MKYPTANKILDHPQSKRFRRICKQRLKDNEHKTMDVHYRTLFNNLKREFFEAVEAYYKEEFSGLSYRQHVEKELADLSNSCLLLYLGLNGIGDKRLISGLV